MNFVDERLENFVLQWFITWQTEITHLFADENTLIKIGNIISGAIKSTFAENGNGDISEEFGNFWFHMIDRKNWIK